MKKNKKSFKIILLISAVILVILFASNWADFHKGFMDGWNSKY